MSDLADPRDTSPDEPGDDTTQQQILLQLRQANITLIALTQSVLDINQRLGALQEDDGANRPENIRTL